MILELEPMKWYPGSGPEFNISCSSGCHDCEKFLGPFTTDEECIRVMRERGWMISFFLDGRPIGPAYTDGRVAGGACHRCVEEKRGPMFGQDWL